MRFVEVKPFCRSWLEQYTRASEVQWLQQQRPKDYFAEGIHHQVRQRDAYFNAYRHYFSWSLSLAQKNPKTGFN
jgi:hypothetical protein